MRCVKLFPINKPLLDLVSRRLILIDIHKRLPITIIHSLHSDTARLDLIRMRKAENKSIAKCITVKSDRYHTEPYLNLTEIKKKMVTKNVLDDCLILPQKSSTFRLIQFISLCPQVKVKKNKKEKVQSEEKTLRLTF